MCYNGDMLSGVKVSVLVPIYNVEDFLPECLDSLVKQTLKEIEIICINDGSTDSSLEIIKNYAKNDGRIVVVNKKNSGYGDSMNKGLDRATGEYVGIVESDDFIDLDAFEKMYKLARKHELDVLKSNFYEYVTKKKRDVAKSNMFLPDEENEVLDTREHRHVLYEQPSIWSAIYRRAFLNDNDIRFLPSPGASYQDAGFNFKVWAAAKRVMMINRAFLHYRQDNPNSSVKSDGKVYAVKDEYDEVERWLKEKNLYDEYGNTLVGMRFSSYIWNMRRLTRKTAKEFAGTIKEDLVRLTKEGMLEKEKLDDVSLYNIRQLPISHPMLYLNTRPFYESRNKIKCGISRALKTVCPKYKQRLETISIIGELINTKEDLERKIDSLEEKIKTLEEKKK